VTEFPLLEYDEEEKRYVAKHHPFTSPMDEDVELLDTDPLKVRAKAYDIVLNGTEIGGGSIRIHSQELQSKMFKLLGFSEKDAWTGSDSFLRLSNTERLPRRNGIRTRQIGNAYGRKKQHQGCYCIPKVQNSSCLMTNAPDEVEPKQLEELKIRVDLQN